MGQNIFIRFLHSESGAVTVDWVVLTAAIVGLGLAVTVATGPDMTQLAGKISDAVGGIELGIGGAEAGAFNPGNPGYEYFTAASNDEEWIASMAADASNGFNFDNPKLTESWHPEGFDHPAYTSTDGQSYSINGTIYSVSDSNEFDFWSAHGTAF